MTDPILSQGTLAKRMLMEYIKQRDNIIRAAKQLDATNDWRTGRDMLWDLKMQGMVAAQLADYELEKWKKTVTNKIKKETGK